MHLSDVGTNRLGLRAEWPPYVRYAIAVAAVAAALLLTRLVPTIQSGAPFMFFFLAIVISAYLGGLRAGIFAVLLSTFAVNIWVFEPVGTFILGLGRPFQLTVFLVVSTAISWLVYTLERARRIIDEQHESLRATLGSIGDAVIATDTAGNVAWMNNVAAELTGYSPEEVSDTPLHQIFNIVNEQTRAPVENPATRVLAEGRVVGLANHTILIAKDGRERPIDDSAAPIRDARGRLLGVVLIFRDISERKDLESALRESQAAAEQAHQSLVAVVERVDDSFYAVDREWRITYINQRACERVGVTAEQAIGRSLWEVFPRLLGTVYETEYRKVMESQQVAHFEARGVLSDKWYEATVYPSADGLSILGRDITERKQAEAALRASERLFSTAFHASPQPMCITEVEDGRFVDVNESFARMVAAPRTEIVGRTSLDIGIWTDAKERARIIAEIPTQGGTRDFDHHFLDRNEKGHEIQSSVQWIELDGQRRLLSVLNDVTEQRQAERALRESEEKFAKVFHSGPLAIVVTRLADGRIIEVNETFITLFGYTREQVLERTPIEIGAWVEPVQREKWLAQLRAGHSVHNAEVRFHTADRRERVCLISAEIIEINGESCVVTVINDITERKQAEQALAESEEKFARVFHSGPLAIAITRLADGRIIEVNDTFVASLGYTREDALGRTPIELELWIDPSQREQGLAQLRAGRSVRNTEVRFRTKDNRERTCFISAEIVEINGEPSVVTVISDVTERVQAEQALHENEQRFRTALKQAPITLAQIDRDLRYTWLHNPHPDISPEAKIGLPFGEQLPADQRTKLTTLIGQVIETGVGLQTDYYGDFTDGRRYYDAIIEPYTDETGSILGVTVAALNVTPHRRMAEALRAAAEELQTLMDILPVGVFVAHDPQAHHITGNHMAYQMFRQPVGTNLSKTAPLDERPAHFKVYRHGKELSEEELPFSYAVAHGVEVRDTETELHFDDGDTAHIYGHAKPLFDAGGNVRGCVGIYLDITTLKHYERRLAHHAFILENIRDAVIAMDTEGRITLWNRGAEELYGYPSHEALGRYSAEVVGTDSTVDGRRSIEKIVQTSGRHVFEVMHRDRRGQPLEVEVVMAALRGEASHSAQEPDPSHPPTDEQQLTGYVGIIRDIAERKQLERELRQLNETLEQRVQERTTELEQINRELDQFAYIASHDLKAPLRAISLLSEWIREDAGNALPPASREHLEKMQGRVQRMDKLLTDLLAYSRAGRLRYPPEQVDTAALVRNIIDLLHLPSGLTVTVAEEMPTLTVETVPLETVLRNLIGNAMKHHDRPESGHVSISARRLGRWVEFSVRDDGPGIDGQFHERIFGVFQTLRPRDEVEGSGMGLAIVKRIVESRGGAVRVESEPGEGATFRFTWPTANEDYSSDGQPRQEGERA